MPTLHNLNLAVERAAGRLAGNAHGLLVAYDQSDDTLLREANDRFAALAEALKAYDQAVSARCNAIKEPT